MRKLLLWSAIVFVFGILFLLMHQPGGNVMTIAGGSCLIVVMVLFIIGKIVTRE
jgi:F0F1-type ATP synthase assembly protein I